MKGSVRVEMSPIIEEFVHHLQDLAQAQFPVSEVGPFFEKNPIPLNDLESYIFFADQRYTRNLIYKTPSFELILLCWASNQASPIHGHEGEKCWMRVELGSLTFTNYQEKDDGALELVNEEVGEQGFVDGPAIIHKVENKTKQPAISLHLYARPFKQCDVFDHASHEKTKVSLSYFSMYGQLINESIDL